MADDDDLNEGDDEIQSMIGQQLRQMYNNILSEPIPDSIVELLVKLDDVSVERPGKTPEQ
ncbi:MAG: hypothetical protein AcusKO_31460 [Acuticoccus sp.]